MKISKGFIFISLAAISWAVAIVLSRVVLAGGENPYVVQFWTALIGLPCWFFIAFKAKTNPFRAIKKNDYLLVFIISLISGLGIGITEVFALKHSQAMNYSLL